MKLLGLIILVAVYLNSCGKDKKTATVTADPIDAKTERMEARLNTGFFDEYEWVLSIDNGDQNNIERGDGLAHQGSYLMALCLGRKQVVAEAHLRNMLKAEISPGEWLRHPSLVDYEDRLSRDMIVYLMTSLTVCNKILESDYIRSETKRIVVDFYNFTKNNGGKIAKFGDSYKIGYRNLGLTLNLTLESIGENNIDWGLDSSAALFWTALKSKELLHTTGYELFLDSLKLLQFKILGYTKTYFNIPYYIDSKNPFYQWLAGKNPNDIRYHLERFSENPGVDDPLCYSQFNMWQRDSSEWWDSKHCDGYPRKHPGVDYLFLYYISKVHLN